MYIYHTRGRARAPAIYVAKGKHRPLLSSLPLFPRSYIYLFPKLMNFGRFCAHPRATEGKYTQGSVTVIKSSLCTLRNTTSASWRCDASAWCVCVFQMTSPARRRWTCYWRARSPSLPSLTIRTRKWRWVPHPLLMFTSSGSMSIYAPCVYAARRVVVCLNASIYDNNDNNNNYVLW